MFGILVLGIISMAQVIPRQGVQKRIQFPEYDRATGRIKSLLTGKRAIPQKNGQILVVGARLETYGYDGAVRNIDLIIEAPRCLFNFQTRVASSTGPMRAFRVDGGAVIEGRGFVWEQRSATLVISNNVRTVMENGFTPKQKNDKDH
jgi:hypothetical protein